MEQFMELPYSLHLYNKQLETINLTTKTANN